MKWSWRQAVGLEKKDISPWRGDASFEDRDNFVTNRVTLADYNDSNCGNPMTIGAVFACVRLLAGTISSLPLMVYRNVDGVRVVARDHPLYRPLHNSPNRYQTAMDFWEFVVIALELHGNAYARIIRSTTGAPYNLIPICAAVTVRRVNGGALEYTGTEDGKAFSYREYEVLHIRGFGGNTLCGSSTLSLCSSTFQTAVATTSAASNMFMRGAMPSGILSTDKTLTPDQRNIAEKLLVEKFTGAHNIGRPMLLDNAVKWEQLTISPEDAQMLESRRFSLEEICRIFGVPPSMVGSTDGSSMWGTGLEQQLLGFQKFSLRPRLKRIEQALEKQLLSDADISQGVVLEFNIEGLLRGDTKTRFDSYEKGVRMGIYTRNEVRALENLPAKDGADELTVQMQDVALAPKDDGEENAA